MGDLLSAAGLLAGLTVSGIGILVMIGTLLFGCLILFRYWWCAMRRPLRLSRFVENPILSPNPANWWESEAVFNPAAFVIDGKVHLLYRAMGGDGISRIGYASSCDGVHFDRLPYPVYSPSQGFGIPRGDRVHGPLSYSQQHYASGGGWGGVEDPRLVKIDDRAYMTFVAFDGWGFVRMALTSLPLPKFSRREWQWKPAAFLSPPNEIHKNWVLFPEKISGKFAILHSITPRLAIEYVDSLDQFDDENTYIHGSTRHGGRADHWDKMVRGAGAPPIKTALGWLLLYHGMDTDEPHVGYKLGAMLLDLRDPTRVLHRTVHPILVPTEWYENDWKPGVIIATGAVVVDGSLIVYYGGGDKHVAAAKANLEEFLHKLTTNQHAVLTPVGR